MIRCSTFALAAVVASIGIPPVRAEPTPALPFFSKPFPTGYTSREPSCIERRLIRTGRGWRTRTVYTCGPVLHARY